MTTCRIFRRHLEQWLAGRERFVPFEHGAHLATCERCRELLECERALEGLLDTLPTPELPPEVAQRVLIRLAAERADVQEADELDRLLEQADSNDSVPRGLAAGVLAGLASERLQPLAAELDDLLDRMPSEPTPVGLSARVLNSLAAERARGRQRRPWVWRLRWPAAAIAGVLLAGWWALSQKSMTPDDSLRLAAVEAPLSGTSSASPSDELAQLLMNLDLLENWELLVPEELELLLASVDELDEALLDVPFEDAVDMEAPGPSDETPSKG